ncbi:cytochrome P450 [Lentzea flaviverrucosa]|uniref:Cytochrome P450 n=1 Tax=Lentzea flaviverrucosa TaxID=200379 RepID=A0A1H9HC08_9PSEU|nr:cytochrome P450 [Lentzea flaviverrucosa]RDI34638.1 cytochrome P450 [Lentzea flaviverrucosa]SEQ59816.1 Cytochrome P450 [Lentzea flaviverrucosa]
MSETTVDTSADLATFPTARDSGCPFDPPAEYAELRAREGTPALACPVGVEARVVSRYADVRAMLGDPHLSSHAAPSTHVVAGGLLDRPVAPGSLLNMDGPAHARLRRLLTPEFTVKRIQAMRPYIQGLVDDHLDALLARTGPVDLVADFALPIPSLVICELLGVDYADRDRFQEQTAVLIGTNSDPAALEQANLEVVGFMTQLVLTKLAAPGDDLLGRLIVRAGESGQELSVEELVTLGITLLIAGHETTANMIGLSTLALLRQPDQLAALRADPGLAGTAVDEMLRYLSIVQFGVLRQATGDLTIGDETIKAGEWLVAVLSAGNRDESVFPDPDRIDLEREATAHLAFGYGIHQCLGQQLARVELQEVFARLHQRIPTLRLAVPFEQIEFKNDALVYGVRALPVIWDREEDNR